MPTPLYKPTHKIIAAFQSKFLLLSPALLDLDVSSHTTLAANFPGCDGDA
jgi:hypothetical protein